MLSVVLDFEEDKPQVFFAMDNAEVEIHEDGSVSVVFEEHDTQRTVQVSLGPYLLEQIRSLQAEGAVGCHYVEDPMPPAPEGVAPF